jgi:dUTP pyrophosphatase
MTSESAHIAGVLSRQAIASLIASDPPLLSDYVNLEQQLQPNGFDLTVRSVASYVSCGPAGSIGIADADRRLSDTCQLTPDVDGWVQLPTGPYLLTFNEAVNLPRWLMALCRSRSSLLRTGVAIHTAVWDAGYSGRSQAMLNVYHAAGFWLQRDARVAQMVFLTLAAPDSAGYSGRYQGENL